MKTKIYLDTTIFNHALWSSNPLFKEASCWLLEEIAKGTFEAWISDEVLREINNAPKPLRDRLNELIISYPIQNISPIKQTDQDLAERYLLKGLIPRKYDSDALHIAIASLRGLDAIASLNFEHIVKLKTNILVNVINAQENLRPIEIRSPGALRDETIRSR